jgi:hypothetical protein
MTKPANTAGAHEPAGAHQAAGPPTDAVTHRIFVDAIDDDVARLMWKDEAFTVPVPLLPTGTREGAWLYLRLARDEGGASGEGESQGEGGAQGGEEIRRRLVKDDPGGDIKL